MAKQKIDWKKAKKDFLESRMTSLKDVAEKYGISYGYLRKISMREDWRAEKKQFWKCVNKVVNKELQRIITEKVRRDCRTQLRQLDREEKEKEQMRNNNNTFTTQLLY